MDEDDPGDKFLNGHVTDVGVYFDDKPYSLLEALESTYVPLSIHGGLLNRLAIECSCRRGVYEDAGAERFAVLDEAKKETWDKKSYGGRYLHNARFRS